MKLIDLLFLATFVAGCGTSSEFSSPSGFSMAQGQAKEPAINNFLVQADSGRLAFRDHQVVALQLLGAKVSSPDGQNNISLREFLRQVGASPKGVSLTYQDGSGTRTVNFTANRLLLASETSLSLAGPLDPGTPATPTATSQITAPSLSLSTAKVSSSSAEFVVRTSTGYTVRLQSLDPDNPFNQSVVNSASTPPVWNVPVSFSGSSTYQVTISQSGSQDIIHKTEVDRGENVSVTGLSLVPNGTSTGVLSAHVRYDDLFNSNANNAFVSFRSSDSLFSYEGVTDSDGTISFVGVKRGVVYTVTARGDFGDPVVGSVGSDSTIQIVVPGRF